MFLCPKCSGKIKEGKCLKCEYQIPYYNGIYYYTEEENINISDEGKKYIGYDEININFDPAIIYWKDHYGIYEACAKDIVNKRGKEIVVLDIGCGLGTATIPFSKFGATAIGVDISTAMLEYAHKRSEVKSNNLIFCKMNAYQLMLESCSVDVIVENAMIHLVDNPEKVYQEMVRVLKPNGVLIRYSSMNLEISKEQRDLSTKCYSAFKDIRDYYENTLKGFGYEVLELNHYSKEIEEKYFYTNESEELQPILDYTEEFKEYMKFRIHRIAHKAHSYLQHVPDEIHNQVWEITNKYAKDKYGEDYKNMPNYTRYKAAYDIYLKTNYK